MSAPKKRFKILLAEDDDDDFLIFQEDLLKHCYPCEVIRVVNGEEALAFLATNTPDVIFLDNHMPRKEGIEVLIEIRRDERLNKVPILILTGSQREDDRVTTALRTVCVRKPLQANLERFRAACVSFNLPLLKL